MKISINWMLDHIATSISTIDIGSIVAHFNIHTAEIESYHAWHLDIDNLFLVTITAVDHTQIQAYCQELKQSINLTIRKDLQVGQHAFVCKNGTEFNWQKLAAYCPEKEGLFPAVDCPTELITGGWRLECETDDYIIEIDNKSINHRPDLWGHRGIAGEVAAYMGWQIKPLEQLLAHAGQIDYPVSCIANQQSSLNISIIDSALCQRIAALHCTQITHKSSTIWMAMRLARIDSKPINTIVDITNYVMFDISQPMHVFDAAAFTEKKIEVRAANNHEQIELLDGQIIQLTNQDIVLTDGKNPVAMAGVMGGKSASFHHNTKAIIIESGAFAAAVVRASAARAKVHSQAAIRFAKQLDPMQNTLALQRFLFLAQGCGVIGTINEKIVSIGTIIHPKVISLSHDFIEQSLGIQIDSHQIVLILTKLQMAVSITKQDLAITYHVTIPTNRMTKDLTIKQDIVEEIARLYGYANISYKQPTRVMKSHNLNSVMRIRAIKNQAAFSMNMHEVRDYLFYDESFLQQLNWHPINGVEIKNPVSENWKFLVTSLIPHLIKNVTLNIRAHKDTHFFEIDRIWKQITPSKASEQQSFAGIFFGQNDANFYDYKAMLQKFFYALNIPITWEKISTPIDPWFEQFQTAQLILDGKIIGTAGMIDQTFIRSVLKGSGFVFEIIADEIINYQPTITQFHQWSKYQQVTHDISILVDQEITASSIEQLILQTHDKISNVKLIDYFEKKEWVNKRSLTFRYTLTDFDQNISKETIDLISQQVIDTMITNNAQVR